MAVVLSGDQRRLILVSLTSSKLRSVSWGTSEWRGSGGQKVHGDERKKEKTEGRRKNTKTEDGKERGWTSEPEKGNRQIKETVVKTSNKKLSTSSSLR